MPVKARITYCLSEQGRRDSLRKGGDGRRLQCVSGPIEGADLDAFTVDDDGQASFDIGDGVPVGFPLPSGARWISKSPLSDEAQWDVVPEWDDLVGLAREVNECWGEMAEDQEKREAARKEAAQAFLINPFVRASAIHSDHVFIDDHVFKNAEPAAVEARRRLANDLEEIEKEKRATLSDWIGRNGSDNQRDRLLAGLLPWKEAYATAEESLYRPLSEFSLYRRFDPEGVCGCVTFGGLDEPCKVKFQSVDAVELTAEEWDHFSKIKVAVPGATFQLREHRAQCLSVVGPLIRRGVIVKFALGQLTFKREFALTEVE